jgi:glyoxylate reductase
MTRPTVFVTRRIPDAGLDMLKRACEVRLWEDELPPPRADLLRAVADAEGLLCLLTDRIDAAVMDAAPRLKVISNFAVGYDNIDVTAATQRRLPVGNTPGILTETTADCAFALLMAAARRIVEGADFVRAGRWKTWGPMLLMGQDVHGATLGIVGMGRIGLAVARRAQGFAMRVLYHDRAAQEAARQIGAEWHPLDEVLAAADFLSLHVPLTPETHHLIGAREFRLMKSTAVLINTARGGVVDPAALYEALRSGEIAGAALDVTEPEPIRPDDPLLTLPNCLIVPHIGSSSHATRGKMAAMAAANLLAGLRGERLPHCVNPAVYGE